MIDNNQKEKLKIEAKEMLLKREKDCQEMTAHISDCIDGILYDENTKSSKEKSLKHDAYDAFITALQFSKLVDIDFFRNDLNNIPESYSQDQICVCIKEFFFKKGIFVREIYLGDSNWYKNDFRPIVVSTKDGKNAYCVYKENGCFYASIGDGFEEVDDSFIKNLNPRGFGIIKPFGDGKISTQDLIAMIMPECASTAVGVIFFIFISSILDLIYPILVNQVLGDVVPNANSSLLAQYFFLVVVTAIVLCIFNYIESKAIISMKFKIEWILQSALWHKIINLPVSFFKNYLPGELATRAGGFQKISESLTSEPIKGLVNTFFLIPSFILMLYYGKLQTLWVFIFVFIVAVIISSIVPVVTKLGNDVQTESSKVEGTLVKFLNGITKLKVAGAELSAINIWIDSFSDVKAAYKEKAKAVGNITILNKVLLSTFLLVIIGSVLYEYYHYDNDFISAADFAAFIQAAIVFGTTFVNGINGLVMLLEAMPIFKQLDPIFAAEPEIKSEIIQDYVELDGNVEFKDVCFSYNGNGNVLNNINISIKAGEYVAITGESGSGKSTLLRLLLGFEKPTSGAILYDGKDMLEANIKNIRKSMGVVLQNATLLPDTIFHNITGYSNDFTREQVMDALKRAGLENDIKAFPMGIDTYLTGANTISGGQKQRLMIAKAIVRNPKIMILDEATSALDNITQKIVTDTMDSIKATKIVVAHRLSTIKNADKIYVLYKGNIIEEGNFQTLMKNDGYFAQLARRQLAGNEQLSGDNND